MKRSLSALMLVSLWLASGCARELDYCGLLTVDEVSVLDESVVSFQTREVRFVESVIPNCVYLNIDGEEVFSISAYVKFEHDIYDLMQGMGQHAEGDWQVFRVDGGEGGAALFSEDYEQDKFRRLIINGSDWSMTSQAARIKSINDPNFEHVRLLTLKALERFSAEY